MTREIAEDITRDKIITVGESKLLNWLQYKTNFVKNDHRSKQFIEIVSKSKRFEEIE